jgi:hypothetical protein
MGGVLGPKNGSTGGGSSRAQNNPFFRPTEQKTITSAGKITVSIADPSNTIKSSIGNTSNAIVGLGKGIVSIAENLPILGGITKPVIGAVGTIADATIGTGVRALEGVRLDIGGKKNLAKKLASMIPEHETYVEPYAGGAALFFNKKPSKKDVEAWFKYAAAVAIAREEFWRAHSEAMYGAESDSPHTGQTESISLLKVFICFLSPPRPLRGKVYRLPLYDWSC